MFKNLFLVARINPPRYNRSMRRKCEPAEALHCFEPVFDENSKVLLLGTMPSPKSRENGFYYSHPQNRMWRVLARVFEESVPEGAEQKRAMLLKHGVAMWDVLKKCKIAGASDASIMAPVPNDIALILRAAPIRAVYSTGTKAAQLYRRYIEPETRTPIAVLPSTSPANAAVGFEALAEAYGVIRAYL